MARDPEWKDTDTGREAKFYPLTRTGPKQLETEMFHWEQLSDAVALILRTAEWAPECAGLAVFGARRWLKQLDSEFRFHLEQQINTNVAAGIPPGAALEFFVLPRECSSA
jgi:hypothetical protein